MQMQQSNIRSIDYTLSVIFSLALFFFIPAIFIFEFDMVIKITALLSLLATILVLKAMVYHIESQLKAGAGKNLDHEAGENEGRRMVHHAY